MFLAVRAVGREPLVIVPEGLTREDRREAIRWLCVSPLGERVIGAWVGLAIGLGFLWDLLGYAPERLPQDFTFGNIVGGIVRYAMWGAIPAAALILGRWLYGNFRRREYLKDLPDRDLGRLIVRDGEEHGVPAPIIRKAEALGDAPAP